MVARKAHNLKTQFKSDDRNCYLITKLNLYEKISNYDVDSYDEPCYVYFL